MSSKLSAFNNKIIIVISEFNQPVTEKLLEGARKAYLHHGGVEKDLKIYRVPGAFEIPGMIRQIMKFYNPHAIVALGAIIRGETPHFDYVAGESIRGIAEISSNSDIPIINGVLTTDNPQQAFVRSQARGKNKGWDAMEAALQTISVYQEIQTAH